MKYANIRRKQYGIPTTRFKSEKGPKAVIKTNRGDITVQLFPELAPKTVQNFIELSKKVIMMA